jgi:Protein of unknown function (DUF3126)
LKQEEIVKLNAYLRKQFNNPAISVRKRPQKTDSAEVYIGEDFIGVMSRDEEDGELSYHFAMSILEIDLE